MTPPVNPKESASPSDSSEVKGQGDLRPEDWSVLDHFVEKEASEHSAPQGLMELRVKVAELCGWEFPVDLPTQRAIFNLGSAEEAEIIPDYPNDLNACAEFEKWLSDGDKNMYVSHLSAEIGLAGKIAGIIGSTITAYKFATATAEQRCRAFIATMEATSVQKTKTRSNDDSG